eukprot:CAMPEP_0204130324 /NCGR_PEP_ID=MMETSP0361-20130328/13293_1 /ASSEMBLY_ACC=CAM_ASM_000343 /TAXON_ID=268821 /ORGANISM="Scrippsiella Hangoei, Strain SHTV-5" /LENGTH=382 /DNA_ID=CAMNT_0051082883 /DNA_START=36 /DNA_END=1184 /DNA_ORIENTATION=-
MAPPTAPPVAPTCPWADAQKEESKLALNLSIGALVGEGTSGKVSQLLGSIDGGRYVVKQVSLKRVETGDCVVLADLVHEVRLHRLCSAGCSSIVRYIFAHASEDSLVVTMEACDLVLWDALTPPGGAWNLPAAAAYTGELQPDPVGLHTRLLHLSLQLCQAVRHCHALRVLHRDLNPWNVFLARCPGQLPSWNLRVGDFGLAAQLPENVKEFEGLRAEGCTALDESALGSLYSAPELGKRYGLPADAFSMGMTLLALWLAGACKGGADELVGVTEAAKAEAEVAGSGPLAALWWVAPSSSTGGGAAKESPAGRLILSLLHPDPAARASAQRACEVFGGLSGASPVESFAPDSGDDRPTTNVRSSKCCRAFSWGKSTSKGGTL